MGRRIPTSGAATPRGTAAEDAFLDAYISIQCKSTTAAAVKAGFKPAYGPELMMRESVRVKLAERRKRLADEVFVEAADVLREAMNVASSNINELLEPDADGLLTVRGNIPEHAWRAIKSVTVKREHKDGSTSTRTYRGNRGRDAYEEDEGSDDSTRTELKIELHDKVGALKLIAQALGMMVPKLPNSGGKVDWEQAVREANKRLQGG